MQEVWKPVVGYEGIYEITNTGKVYSLPKKWIGAKECIRSHNGKYLSVQKSTAGYFRVLLSKDGISKTREIHQLVAEAFLNHTPCGYKLVVDHIDNDKTNNKVCNLQLITQRENASKNSSKSINEKSSKYVGVCFDKSRNKYQSRIKINNKTIFIGRFETEYEAHLAYQQRLKELENGK